MAAKSVGVENSWTVQQFADEFDYHPEYVRRLIRSGQLDAVKVKGWRISKEAVEKFLQDRSANG